MPQFETGYGYKATRLGSERLFVYSFISMKKKKTKNFNHNSPSYLFCKDLRQTNTNSFFFLFSFFLASEIKSIAYTHKQNRMDSEEPELNLFHWIEYFILLDWIQIEYATCAQYSTNTASPHDSFSSRNYQFK